MSRKSLAVTVLSLATWLAACAVAAAQEQITWGIWGRSDEWSSLADLFMKENPDIKVNLYVASGNEQYKDKIPVMFAAGNAPDVMFTSFGPFADWAAAGMFLPLDSYAKRDGFDLNAFFPPAVTPFRWDEGNAFVGSGQLYGFPVVYQLLSMFVYNQDLFDAAGLSYPDAGWTWNDALDAARKITHGDSDAKTNTYGFATMTSQNFWQWPIVWSAGAHLINETYTRLALDEPAALEAMGMLVDATKDGLVGPDLNFLSGKYGMSSVGYYNALTKGRWQQKSKFKWDIALFPKYPSTGQSVDSAGINGVSISSTSKHVEAAWRLVKFLGSKEAQLFLAQKWDEAVARPDAAAALYFRPAAGAPGGLPKHLSDVAKALNNVYSGRIGKKFPDLRAAMSKSWVDILAQKIDLKSGVNQMVEDTKPIFAEISTKQP